LEQLKQETHKERLKFDQMKFVGQLQEEIRVNNAKIAEIESKALLEAAQAEGIKSGHQVEYMNAMVGLLKLQNEDRQHRIDTLLEGMKIDQQQQALDKPATVGNVAK